MQDGPPLVSAKIHRTRRPFYLTITAPATTTLSGFYNVSVCGNSSTCDSDTSPGSTIALGVDIPNATIVSGSPVLNNGNTVTTTYNIARATIQGSLACTTPQGVQVQCSVSSSPSGTQLQITAPRTTAHGTYIYHLNGLAVSIASEVGDDGPELDSISPWQQRSSWSASIPISLSGDNLTGCTLDSVSEQLACWQASLDFTSTSGGGSPNVVVTSDSSASGSLLPDSAGSTYGWRANTCADFFSVQEGPHPCTSDWAYLTVAGGAHFQTKRGNFTSRPIHIAALFTSPWQYRQISLASLVLLVVYVDYR